MKVVSIILSIICVCALSSCNKRVEKIHEGKVIRKIHEPERKYLMTSSTLVGKVPLIQLIPVIDDEDFIIVVEGATAKDSATFYLDESNWNCIKVGDIFNDSIPCYENDDPEKQPQ